MTLVSEIIRDAYRESNLIAASADPTSAEQDEGLRLLNRIVSYSYGVDAGEELQPVLIGRNNIQRPQGFPYYDQVPDETEWYVPDNSRLILNLQSPQTVYLDPDPRDGARFAVLDKSNNLSTNNFTVIGNGRTIDGATSLVVSIDSADLEFFYRADTGDWAQVSPLAIDDTFPFPTEFDDMFVIELALRINPRHGRVIDNQSLQIYSKLSRHFKARYRQTREVAVELGLLRTTGVKRGYWDIRKNNRDFETGRSR